MPQLKKLLGITIFLFSPLLLAGLYYLLLQPTEPDWFQGFGWSQIFMFAFLLPLALVIQVIRFLVGKYGSSKRD